MASFNWQKFKSEVVRLSDIELLKTELKRLSKELKNFDIHVHLSPTAKQRLSKIEKRFNQVLASLQQAQKQVDVEVAKVVGQLKKSRGEFEKQFAAARKMALQQRSMVQKKVKALAKNLNKRSPRKSGKKKSTRSA